MASSGGVAVDDAPVGDPQDWPPPQRKNIVICCDGTGNKVSGNLSNVLKLFRIVRKDERQRVPERARAVRFWQQIRDCRDDCPAAAAPRS